MDKNLDFSVLDNRISTYCKDNNIFGALRITYKDKILFQKQMGYSNMSKKLPITEKSMFTFYSLSKPFCAIGLLLLKDKGLVNIDLHPSVYVKEAKGFDERVTIRQMLQHVSGLPDFEQNAEFASSHRPGYAKYVRGHLAELTNYPQYFEPGTADRYANVNFVLCALIIENVSGLTYPQYMQKFVFEPLGMNTALIDDENLKVDNRVQGYELINDMPCEVQKSHNWLLGAGDMVGTVEDVYALNKAIKNRLLLCEETWEEVLTPSSINSMGMGCTITNWHGKTRITHNGGHYGFRTLHIQLPEDDFDIIFLSNSGYGRAREDISQMIYNFFYGEESSGNAQTSNAVSMDKGYI